MELLDLLVELENLADNLEDVISVHIDLLIDLVLVHLSDAEGDSCETIQESFSQLAFELFCVFVVVCFVCQAGFGHLEEGDHCLVQVVQEVYLIRETDITHSSDGMNFLIRRKYL